jgi:hypothetical protein
MKQPPSHIVEALQLRQSATFICEHLMAKTRAKTPLPKAPLAEVVFELRWALQAGPEGVPILQSDPGLIPLLDQFPRK